MKRFRQLAWPLVLCYFVLALTVLAKDINEGDQVRLKVSIGKDTLTGVSSCHHTFSQIELLNLHTTESIMIHSIQTAPEETVLIRSASGKLTKSSWENIPQQLHVSRLPSGTLSLGPGQVAIVPVTFLPRYPHLAHDNCMATDLAARTLPTITSAARLDLGDLLGDSVVASFEKQNSYKSVTPSTRRRSNLEPSSLPAGDEFEVRTSIVIDSSRGVLQVPLTASSVRENPYSIPDVIRFHHSSPSIDTDRNRGERVKNAAPVSTSATIGSDGSILLNSITYSYTGTNDSIRARLSRRPDISKDCFDIYIKNPSLESFLEVSEILVSRPDLMSVEFDPAKLLLAPDLLVIPQHPSQAVREWTEEGPMYVPPDSVDNYIATVCTAPNGVDEDPMAGSYLEEMSNWIDSGNPEQSLGFLQIRTNTETLFISLERLVDKVESKARVSTIETLDENVSLRETMSSEPTSSLLKTTPGELNFRFLSSAGPPASATIALQNKSPVPIRIMRVSASLDGQGHANMLENLNRLGLQLNITRGGGENSDLLPAAGSIENAIFVTCQTNADPTVASLNEKSFHFQGSILIRGTMDTELAYDDWKVEMIRDPFRDIHLTVEIPLTISVLNGRVEVTLERSTHPYPQIFDAQSWDQTGRAVSMLFFPFTRFDALEDSESPLPTQKYMNSRQIGHDLRIMTNMALPLQLELAEIVDKDNLPIDGKDTPCARFNVSRARPFETNNIYHDFEDLGFLALQYRFDIRKERYRQTEDREPAAPTTCFLNIVTSSPDTLIHQIPLIVFPAELEITSPSRVGTRQTGRILAEETETMEQNKDQGAVLVGYETLLGWFRSSAVGKAFLQFLDSQQEKGNQRDSVLLTKYVRNLLDLPDDAERSTIQPILLKIGAIEHGEISDASLVLTNHNPIPVTVAIDVGEVEGMSIELERDGGQGPGDGSSLFDFIPSDDDLIMNSDQTILKEGSFKGHPVHGLRQFLLSLAQRLHLSEGFPFRDAVYLSKEAVEKQPFLEKLYRWHSYAEFHRNQQADVPFQSHFGHCDPSIRPPEYQSSEDIRSPAKQQQLSGPLIISGGRELFRPLKTCSDRESSLSDSEKIMIPPGGTARFWIKLRSPPLAFLENDISQLLSTGLILSSSLGQVMPIFATFEALQGQLHLWKSETPPGVRPNQTSDSPLSQHDTISVPLHLCWRSLMDNKNGISDHLSLSNDSSDFDRIATNAGIPLHVGSSFSREIRLLEIESCNSLFHVALKNSSHGMNSSHGIDVTMGEATRIGDVRSSAFCLPNQGGRQAYPSFFQCVINLLSNRHELQPPGCGSVSTLKRRQGDGSGIDISNRRVRGVIQAFENAMSIWRDKFSMKDIPAHSDANGTDIDRAFYFQPKGTFAIKSGRKRSDGYIDSSTLNTYAEAWDAWQVANEMGLTKLSSNLRATIQYKTAPSGTMEASDGVEYHTLSLSMHDLGIHSALSEPRLFPGQDETEYSFTHRASIMNFPATFVGDVVFVKISLRNPTSVPVRVRLAAAPLTSKTEQKADRGSLMDRFMQSQGSPYVQSESARQVDEQDVDQQWWNGGGGFFLVDEQGDIMQAHHNISIKAGAGAVVSLVNPSLHTISSFIRGCGARCGVHDSAKSIENSPERKHTSIIGAAAVASVTLIGRQRSALPQLNENTSDEPFIYAGGTPTPGNSGPRAFAVPYSSLDEVILPPFGIGEIGPILFRPPGRSLALGCNLVKQSDSSYWGVKVGDLCESEEFSSMVFLENSLTGVERVELRGRSLWEHLYFLDPPPRNGESAFGDIEMRNGRDTLVFSGSGNFKAEGKVTPVIKQVLLHNGGDAPVVIKSVSLSDSNKRWNTKRASAEPCRSGSFLLLDCWDSPRTIFNVDGELVPNIRAGFRLQPGQSRSIHVEHAADCRRREEYVSINIEFIGDNSHAIPQSGRSSLLLPNKKADLVVGYAMDPVQFALCSPVNFWGGDFIVVEFVPDSTPGYNATRQRKLARGRKPGSGHWFARLTQLIVLSLMLALASSLTAHVGKVRSQALERSISRARNSQKDEAKNAGEKKRPLLQSIWYATFRCLARADPTSPELQTLGREQIRQVVAGRYRAKGGSPPSSLVNTGVFVRERVGAPTGGMSRQRTGKEGGGAERVRTLSDALFRTFSSEHGDPGRCLIPAGLGWRLAFARGIINDRSIRASAVGKATTTLFEGRTSRRNGLDLSPGILDGDGSDSESFEGDKDTEIFTNDEEGEETSVGAQPTTKDEVPELKAPEAFPRAVHKPVAVVPSTGKWTQLLKTNEKDPVQPEEPHHLNWTNADSRKPASDVQPVLSPSTSIHSSESSTANDQKIASGKDRKKSNKTRELGHGSGSKREIEDPNSSPRNYVKGKKVTKTPGKSTVHATRRESPGESSRKEASANGTAGTTEKKSKPIKVNDKKTGPKLESKKEQNVEKSMRDESGLGNNTSMEVSTIPFLPPGVSPPPGLAPPPGFNHGGMSSRRDGSLADSPADLKLYIKTGSVESASLGDMLTAALNSDMKLVGSSGSPSLPFSQQFNSSSSDLLFGVGLGETPAATPVADGNDAGFPILSPQVIGVLPTSGRTLRSERSDNLPAPSGDPLIDVLLNDHDSSRNGFDVMDFLDSILDDGGSNEQPGEQSTTPSSLLAGASDGILTSNPWASEKKSRAAAYGIAFDDTEDSGLNASANDGDEAGLAPFPLLTPAAILMAGQDEDGDDDDRALSFYARLTANEE